MWHVIKRLISRADTSSATKIINRHGRDTYFGEAQRQFFIELMQPSHIGIYKHLYVFRACWMGDKGGKAVLFCCCQDDVLSQGSFTGTWWSWWHSVVIVAHLYWTSFITL